MKKIVLGNSNSNINSINSKIDTINDDIEELKNGKADSPVYYKDLADVLPPADGQPSIPYTNGNDGLIRHMTLEEKNVQSYDEVQLTNNSDQILTGLENQAIVEFQTSTFNGSSFTKNGNGIELIDSSIDFKFDGKIFCTMNAKNNSYPITIFARLLKNGNPIAGLSDFQTNITDNGSFIITTKSIFKDKLDNPANNDVFTILVGFASPVDAQDTITIKSSSIFSAENVELMLNGYGIPYSYLGERPITRIRYNAVNVLLNTMTRPLALSDIFDQPSLEQNRFLEFDSFSSVSDITITKTGTYRIFGTVTLNKTGGGNLEATARFDIADTSNNILGDNSSFFVSGGSDGLRKPVFIGDINVNAAPFTFRFLATQSGSGSLIITTLNTSTQRSYGVTLIFEKIN